MTIYEKIKKSALESPNPPFIPYLWSKEYQEDLKKEPEWERLGDPFSSTLKAMRFFNEKKAALTPPSPEETKKGE